ncbi:MAG TPA: hypothetical protein VG755_25355 [Nannocystaceae bacterium]|nr:hypothetical protein [Nannocystaceae bacterium]
MADDDDPLSIGGVSRTAGTTASAGAEAVDGAAAAAGVRGPDEVASAGTTDAIAEALAAGTLDVEAATRELVAQSVANALGPGADPASVAALSAEVEALLAGDPTLADLLRRA